MSKKVSQQYKLIRLWLIQLLLIVIVTLLSLVVSEATAISVFVGGMIFLLPNMYFALYAFRYRGAQASMIMLRSMYRGEFGKLLLTGIGFALAFVLIKPIVPLGLFTSFIGMIFSQWLIVSRW